MVWDANGAPVGLLVDGVAYQVKPAPGLRIPYGDGATVQGLFLRHTSGWRFLVDYQPEDAPQRP